MSVLSEDELRQALVGRDAWQVEDGTLVRRLVGADFAASVEAVNRIAPLADAANHHPDLDIRWDTVTVRLVTHSKGGITAADVALAAGIDAEFA